MTNESQAPTDRIENPDNPNHFMVLKPIERLVEIHSGGQLIARSTSALRLLEVGKSIYDPIIYIPLSDVLITFDQLDKTTYCPIKGHAHYVSFNDEEIGWYYDLPLNSEGEPTKHISFWPNKVKVIEDA